MRFIYFLLFSLTLLVPVMESSAASSDMNSLRQLMARLDKAGAAEHFPDEFGSFIMSTTAAEALVAESGEAGASKQIEFAAMKGIVLEGKLVNLSPLKQSVPGTTGSFTGQQNKAVFPERTYSPSAATFANITTSTQNTYPFQLPEDSLPSQPVAAPARIRTVIPGPDALWGGNKVYVVRKGDTLKVVAAKLGVSWRRLAKGNGLDLKNPFLRTGMSLKYNDRKIVPKNISNGLLVNIPDRTLYHFKGGKIRRTAPITVGKPRLTVMDDDEVSPEEMVKWQTPTGAFTVTGKSKDPIWTVPLSIQEEMRKQGKEVLVKVPPGRKNPLGRYALKTSLKGIMLHSTNMPASIYGYNSHGCIRVSPDAMEDIFRDVVVNTRGEIIYMPVKVAVTEDGRVFVEVHRDVYSKTKDLQRELEKLVRKYDIADLVDWQRAEQLLKQQNGIAEDVTRKL